MYHKAHLSFHYFAFLYIVSLSELQFSISVPTAHLIVQNLSLQASWGANRFGPNMQLLCHSSAGLVKREVLSPAEKTSVTSSGSVFSRLERRINTSPPLHRSSTLSSSPNKRVTVKSSPQRLSITTSSRHRSVSDGASGSGVLRGRNISRKQPGMLVSSSSSSRKESIKKRLGVRGRGERVEVCHGTTSWGPTATTSWGDIVVTTSSSSGRVSTRLGTKQDSSCFPSSTKKPRPTMVADSASNTASKVTSRLGTTKSRAATSTSSNSRSRLTKLKRERLSSSMVADEYELTRQLDIRSRLARKEDEKRERRRGLLRGRLGEHEVFTRLT